MLDFITHSMRPEFAVRTSTYILCSNFLRYLDILLLLLYLLFFSLARFLFDAKFLIGIQNRL